MSKFPKGFLLGSATAAHQVEGNNINSDYWAMEHMEHSTFVEPSLDACDHYNRYEEDIRLMAAAGLNAYRFSIEWARIEPEEGIFDEKEVEHYRQVLECCKKYGIEPIVTMHHFTSPKWLISKGGWQSEKTVEYFARYCKYVVEQLGDYMHYVCTINEANMGLQVAAIAERFKRQMMENAAKMQSAGQAQNNDVGKSLEGTVQVGLNLSSYMEKMDKQKEENIRIFGTENPITFINNNTREGDLLVMRAHQAAKKAIKEVKPELQIGLTLSLHDIQATQGGEKRAKEMWDDEFTHYLPYIKDDDFLGVQNYSRSLVGKDGILPAPEGAELTQMDYEFYPQALSNVIRRVRKELQIPLMVTENGIATADDNRRVAFIKEALKGIQECINDGIPILGYMYWSFLDNFEWQKGYAMNFGLVAVDRKTQKRTAKESLTVLGSYLR